MPQKKADIFPNKFNVLRIVLVSLLLGELLSFISTISLNLKSLATVLNLNKTKILEIKKNPGMEHSYLNNGIYETNLISKKFESHRNLSLILILPVLLIISIYHAPVYRYFRMKRKKIKIPSEKLRESAKRVLSRSAGFLAFIIFLWYLISFIPYLVLGHQQPDINPKLAELSNNFVIVKILSSLLTILFLYLWQNHRVKTYFIQSVFTEEELRIRQHYGPALNIKRQMIVSTFLTTFLPLALIVLYLFTFITRYQVRGNLTNEQTGILLANYQEFFNNTGIPYLNYLKNNNAISYFNAVDTFLLFISIFVGVLITLFYLFCITRWTIAEIIIPIKELQDLMRKVSQGSFSHFAVVRNNDEIGELSEGFNSMAAYIQKDITEITDLNLKLKTLNKELENKVDERTRELQELNKDLKMEVEERVRTEEALLETNNKLRSRNEIMEGELEMARRSR